jgi:sec-independent protein translocase protein TatC
MNDRPSDHGNRRNAAAHDDEPPGAAQAAGSLERKPFLEHLKDLRLTLIKIVAVFILIAIACFVALRPVSQFLRLPLDRLEARKGLEPGTIELITLGPQEGFTALVTVALSAAVGLSLPFTLYFIAQFVQPGLTWRERHAIAPALVIGVLLFAGGAVFAFFVTSPFLLHFLWSLYEGLGWSNTWTVRAYYGFLTRFLLVSGLTFELPLVLTVLVRLGVLTIGQLRHFRRHAIIAILVVCAIITPPDASSMFMVAGPMYLLYEASIVVSVIIERRRRASR